MSEFSCEAVAECGFAEEDFGYADDATWVLTSSFVILTMQSGFGLLEMGSSMAGNEVHIMVKNVVDVVVGSLAYWLLGFGLSFGYPSIPFMGLGDFVPVASYAPTESGLKFSQYIFQFSFAATSTTIVSGCIAMRGRFLVYFIFSFFAVIVYAFVAHWVWAEDGWLRTLGYYDFAGGGPVHLLGGANGAIAAAMAGPRFGYFDGKRPKSVFRPVSPASQLFGLFMLWWGWIGFNCGSTFGITGSKWEVATRAAIATINSTAGGGLISMFYSLVRSGGKTIQVHHVVNGILGSLVATSPTCSVVNTYEALIIGAIGALVAILTNALNKRLKLDDPVGAVGVHAGGGVWGLIAVGLFADGKLPGVQVRNGLFRGGGLTLLGYQLIGIAAIIGWSIACCVPFFYVVGVSLSRSWKNPRPGLRVSVEEELEGADKCLHGIEGPDMYEESEEFWAVPNTKMDSDSSAHGETENDDSGNDDVEIMANDAIDDVEMSQITKIAEKYDRSMIDPEDAASPKDKPRRAMPRMSILGIPQTNDSRRSLNSRIKKTGAAQALS